jgi:hypothetical protein
VVEPGDPEPHQQGRERQGVQAPGGRVQPARPGEPEAGQVQGPQQPGGADRDPQQPPPGPRPDPAQARDRRPGPPPAADGQLAAVVQDDRPDLPAADPVPVLALGHRPPQLPLQPGHGPAGPVGPQRELGEQLPGGRAGQRVVRRRPPAADAGRPLGHLDDQAAPGDPAVGQDDGRRCRVDPGRPGDHRHRLRRLQPVEQPRHLPGQPGQGRAEGGLVGRLTEPAPAHRRPLLEGARSAEVSQSAAGPTRAGAQPGR